MLRTVAQALAVFVPSHLKPHAKGGHYPLFLLCVFCYAFIGTSRERFLFWDNLSVAGSLFPNAVAKGSGRQAAKT